MRVHALARFTALGGAILALAGCGGDNFGGIIGSRAKPEADVTIESRTQRRGADRTTARSGRSSLLDLFTNADPPNTTLEVNKYIWVAAQDVLDFMPIQAADPFSGIIVYGYGTPPGSGRAYRATVYVQDPALDARSLRVALATRSGPASTETVRAVEDAILTRARQLRIQDGNL